MTTVKQAVTNATPMPRYRLTLEYAGTRYSGWQIQKNARTVQGELHRALGTALGGRPFETYGSGRTDAGVHALGQVAHLDAATLPPPASLVRDVNDALPADINVLAAERVPPRFHARHSAVARSYLYQIATRRTAFAQAVRLVGARGSARSRRDAGRRRARSRASAISARSPTTTRRKNRRRCSSMTCGSIGDGALLLIRVVGSHFLWKMVRRIVGVLVEVGRGGLAAGRVGGLLSSTSDLPPKLTAPASGLFLERVFYPGDARDQPLSLPSFA